MTARSMILAGLTAAALALAAGCGPAEVSGGAYYGSPELAYVSPGVAVVADVDAPVFYSSDYYWRYDNGIWFRSPYWYGGWARVGTVPYGVAHVDRPWAYSHFHAYGRRSNGSRRVYSPGVRADVRVRPVPRATLRPSPRPMIRDHRR